MSKYVLSFRSSKDRASSAEQEAAWGQWFEQIGKSVVDWGSRVSQAATLGAGEAIGGTVLSGYIVVEADSLSAASAVAQGCPALSYGGAGEVGVTVELQCSCH